MDSSDIFARKSIHLIFRPVKSTSLTYLLSFLIGLTPCA